MTWRGFLMARRFDGAKCDDWRARLAKFDSSDLTVAEFCRREQVSLASYYYWSRRIRESCSSTVASARPPSKEPVNKLPSKEVTPAAIEIWLRDDVRVVVPASCTEALRLVLQSAFLMDESSHAGKQSPAFHQVLLDTQ
jgi:hypothetical protein